MTAVLRNLQDSWSTLRAHPAFRKAPMRLLARSGLWALHCLVRRPAIVRLGNHGGKLQLPPRFRRGGATGVFVLREQYETEIAYVERVLRTGMVMIDGGANLGIYTILASRLVGSSGRVLAFEPGDKSFRSLVENIALNQAENVRAFKRALADTSGAARLYHSGGGLVSYSLLPDGGSKTPFEEIETTTIDDALAMERIERVDLLKLDVEGAEELALRGAEQLLARARPMVLFELQPAAPIAAGMRHDGAWTLLERHGYELFGVLEGGALVPRAAPCIGNNLALPRNGEVSGERFAHGA